MRLSDLLPAASQPRAAAGRYLGSARAHGRACSAATELCRPNGAPAYQHLRRDQARARAHLGRLDGRARHQAQRAAAAECLRAGPVADEFLHGNSRSFRTIGARAARA